MIDGYNKRAKKLLKKMKKDELILLIQVMEGIDGLHESVPCSPRNKKKSISMAVYLAGSIVIGVLSIKFIPVIQKKIENKIFRQMIKK